MDLRKAATAGTMESNDIMVTLEPVEAGGIQIDLTSNVLQQFGAQIRSVITETLTEYGVENAAVTAVDKRAGHGRAVPQRRLCRVSLGGQVMYIKDRLRRSMMFVPGNNPGMIRDAHIYGADSIMFDLEDSVAYTEKDAARLLVYNALRSLNFGSRETVVRINDLSSGLGIEDLEAVVRAGVQVVRLPKTDSAQDVIDCEREIARIERESGIPVGTTGMMAAIESANGVLNAAEIARASNRLIGIALGAEDYVTDLKTTRSDGIELLFARCMILNAARAAGIAALDTVYSDVNNEEGFLAEAMLIKKLGFDGKSVINPRQIEPLHRVFMPSEKDLNKARLIMAAIEEANARGSGVASLKGKMIDKPVVTRARRLLDLYEAGSKIDEVEEI